MADPIVAMHAVADRLDKAGVDYAFVGGCIVNLLLDHPALAPARPTDDVDVIVEIATGQRYSDLEEKMRALGFQHDLSIDAPLCRWKLGDFTIDVMPTDGKGLKNLDSVDDGRTNLRCSFDVFFVFPIVTDNLRQICHG